MEVLLKSKRFWVTVITTTLHLLASHHIILSDAAISDLADQLILIAGAVGVVITKILDARKAKQEVCVPIPKP